MAKSSDSENFEEIVQWAYSTLPEKIRDLPDFPGIQVVDEPPEEVLKDVAKRRNWTERRELLGLYSGIYRTERQHFQTRIAPDLIFVFRGPILRCSKGNLRAEVQQVVWHEVAHWLGHSEEEVRDLGLSATLARDESDMRDLPQRQAPKNVVQQMPNETIDSAENISEQLRCIKCYSADVACHEGEKLFSYAEANLFDPATVTLHARTCKCNSCGYEWNDEDDA